MIFSAGCVVAPTSLGLAFIISSHAFAACIQSSTTVTCSGGGLGPISYTEADPVDEIIVEDLTGNVGGSDGIAISLSDTGQEGLEDGDGGGDALPASVSFDGANASDTYGITDATDTSVTVSSTGGQGHSGEKDTTLHATGGDGGDGGDGGTSTLTFTGGFVSQTEGEIGIELLSTGGAGGEGGEAKHGTNYIHDAVTTGGSGGIGGDAETAILSLSDLSNPDGGYGIDLSGIVTGISVASTGGAGGNGGDANCNDNTVFPTCKAYSGAGGVGGAAGDVEATITGTDISISSFTDRGIEILSTGGAGGKGGAATANYLDDKVENTPANGYGDGGDGGNAATVLLEVSDSTFDLSDNNGNAAIGVAVSSSGGKGGDGNDSVNTQVADGYHPGWGNGGDGGDGATSELELSNSELSVSLSADDAVGILVSSRGGDGGSEGSISGKWAHDPDEGSDGGAGGHGAPVSATMDSTSVIIVTTTGAGDSMGALTLLSQGGDGGDGGSGGDKGDGNGGDGGNGGRVTGAMTTVEAQTSGDNAYGVYIASLGGDGGTGAAGDGDGGDTNPIDVSFASAMVQTTGDGSHGVYAISQGGAGGDSSTGGDGGDGDWVILTVSDGAVEASGEEAYGIAAISSAGSAGSGDTGKTAGDVTLRVGADVTVSGSGGVGLYVESTGDSSNGDIDVTVYSGATITASGDAAAAISFVNGGSNTLTNNGAITTDDLSNSSIYALKASGAKLSVINNGTFSGAVDFDTTHTNSFTNSSGATLNLSPAFDIGSGGTLTNDGVISPGGSGSVQTSTITGVFTQSSDGAYLVDLDGKSTDRLVVKTTHATLEGTVSVNVISSPSSSGSSLIVQSDVGTMDDSGLTVSDTATMDYSLDHNNNFYVWLDWDVSMDDSDLLGSASGNQRNTAGHLQQVLESGEGALGAELAALLNIVDEDDYIAALDTFASQIASDIQLTSLFSAQRFSDDLLSCSVRDGVYRFVDQDQCGWLRAGGSGMERSSSTTNRPFEQTAWQFEGGGQFAIHDDWFLGAGFSIGTQSLSVDDLANSDGSFYQGGVVAKHTMGNTILSASLTAGYGDFDITRYLYSSDIARGNETLWTVSGQLSASHAFVRGDWYLKPRVDIGFDHVNMDGFTESGAGGASLTIGDNAQTYYSIQPAIEFGGEIAAANGVLFRPSVSVGLTQFLGDAAPATSASFADTPAGIAPFTIGSEFDKTYFDVKAGFEVLATESLSISAEGFGQFSQRISSYGGSAKLAVRF